MKPSNRFIRAAEHVYYTDNFSCSAIGLHSDATVDRDRYRALFSPYAPDQITDGAWLHPQHGNADFFDSEKERREWRLTALCFMAALDEAGDLKTVWLP